MAAVTEHVDGARDADCLGHRPGPHLATVPHCGLARRARDGTVRDAGGERFEGDRAALRAMPMQLGAQSMAERGPAGAPGTMALGAYLSRRYCWVLGEKKGVGE